MKRLIVFVALACMAAFVLPAAAQPGGLVVTLNSATFYPGGDDQPIPLVVPAGTDLLYSNLDTISAHTITAKQKKANGKPLFDSGVVDSSTVEPVTVAGVPALEPGSYPFECIIHHTPGTLTIR